MQASIAAAIAGVMPTVRATGLFPSLFTAQAPSGTFGPSGAPDGMYADVDGLVSIACTAAPKEATEAKSPGEIAGTAMRHVLLDNFYSALDDGWREGWRCVIDGTAYDITGVESDSHAQMTRVSVRLVTV